VTLRIGIDVGGTNTDAVLVDREHRVLARAKTTTTDDPADGIAQALAAVIPADPSEVAWVALGTTHALNALLRRRDLGRVAVIRIGAPATRSVPPFTGWPDDLRRAIDAGSDIVAGGVEVDGRTHPVDLDAARRLIDGAGGAIDGVAITGTFSLQDPSQELEVAAAVAGALGDVPVSLGHRVGGLGLLERENAAIVNASLRAVAGRVIEGFTHALIEHGIEATPFLSQNDGTMMSLERARDLPVLTIGGGPSNSIRGAAALTGLDDAIVIDVGGTSTDVGAIVQGFPRESAAGVELGGVRTNFRMPDVLSVAAGGGTVIGDDGVLGVDSVGHRLTTDSLVFGGEVATLSDAAVAAGRVSMGDPARLAGRTWPGVVDESDRRIADALDRMKLSRAAADVIVVGGGAVLVPAELPGAAALHRPDDADVANAVGAAIGLVSGEAEHVAVVGDDRPAAIEAVLADARERANQAGADPAGIETVWVDEIPLAYMDRPMSRLRAKVAGRPRT
jgi:N-methylhydantoinase A/oxoprolinase/acetone carboxylase beta subunit